MHGVEKVFSWHLFQPCISVIYGPMWLRPLLNQGLRLQTAPRYQRLRLERFTGWPSAKQFSVLWGEGMCLAVTQVSEPQLTDFSVLLISHSAELDLQQQAREQAISVKVLPRKFEWTRELISLHMAFPPCPALFLPRAWFLEYPSGMMFKS